MAMGMVIAVFMTGNMYAYAGYHETTSNHTYAGDTRFLYMLKMDDFSAYAYLDADDESEISLIGYVTDSLGYDDAYAYIFPVINTAITIPIANIFSKKAFFIITPF